MKTEDVYNLAPDQITTEMLDLLRKCFPGTTFEQQLKAADGILMLCQRYYRHGAFNMEHKDGATCQAEDQGGWPACANPAEFYVLKEHLGAREKSSVYCSEHRDNRFFSPEHMAPIYEKPNVDPERA